MGRHICDTRTVRWEIYYYNVHRQSVRTLFSDTLYARRQSVLGGLQRRKSAEKHSSIRRDRISESNGRLAAPDTRCLGTVRCVDGPENGC